MELSTATIAYRQLEASKQSAILQAAEEEFSRKGFRAASMNSLVQQAGISKGSLFQYFGSKEALFLGLVELATGRVRDLLRAVRDESRQQPLPDRLRAILSSGIAFVRQHPRLARIYFQLLQGAESPVEREGLGRLERRSRRFLQRILEEAREQGELGPHVDCELGAFVLNAVFERVLRGAFMDHLDELTVKNGALDALVAHLLCGLGHPAPAHAREEASP